MSVGQSRILPIPVATRRKLLAFAVGLVATGCAAPQQPDAAVDIAASQREVIAAPSTIQPPTGPAGAPIEATDDPAQAIINSVNDSVARADRIIASRNEAQQFAADLRENRAVRETRSNTDIAQPSTVADDNAAIERLAAEIAALRDRAAQRRGESTQTSSEAPSIANGPLTTAGTSSVVTVPASPADSAMASPVQQLEVRRASPTIDREPVLNPLGVADALFVQRVAADPKDLDAQLALQLLRYLKNESVPTSAELASLPSEDRELLSSILDALSNFRSVIRGSPNPLSSDKVRPFVELADRIRAQSDLTITNVALCTEVRAFGAYRPFESLRFPSGRATPVVFYCEIDGFQSQLNDSEGWDTQVSLGLKLFNEAGLELWSEDPKSVTDSSLRRRRDFYLAQRIELPASLTPGRYLMKATVRDLLGKRVDESTIQVDMVVGK